MNDSKLTLIFHATMVAFGIMLYSSLYLGYKLEISTSIIIISLVIGSLFIIVGLVSFQYLIKELKTHYTQKMIQNYHKGMSNALVICEGHGAREILNTTISKGGEGESSYPLSLKQLLQGIINDVIKQNETS